MSGPMPQGIDPLIIWSFILLIKEQARKSCQSTNQSTERRGGMAFFSLS
jgi:hypothetical protein